MSRKSFAETYDYYQAAVYDRVTLVDAIVEQITARRCRRLLDCSCGTGLPALDLRSRGFVVECSDADAQMLEQFRRNARERGLNDSCRQLRWDELPLLGASYDYVMCRGNSLVYAESWSGPDDAPAQLEKIRHNIEAMSLVVKPGGYLHIDLPVTTSLSYVAYPETEFRGQRVLVAERVKAAPTHRRWDQSISIGCDHFNFSRNSADVTVADMMGMLHDVGFEDVESVSLRGERPSYAVLLGRKR